MVPMQICGQFDTTDIALVIELLKPAQKLKF